MDNKRLVSIGYCGTAATIYESGASRVKSHRSRFLKNAEVGSRWNLEAVCFRSYLILA
jgi:hypothetical protein